MNDFGSSENYVWFMTDDFTLGSGAFGSVYKGIHKTTGEEVAVKTFKNCAYQLPQETRDREFEVMKVVCHENIVKLVAIEEEVKVKKKVLIMELCRGGNLQKVLDDPQNAHGLEEKEFLCVLKDLTASLKYLRENNYVHRDLKPANIMKYISEDGHSVYKLADFGSARYLEDDQEYQSLMHGTEEYLNPDAYKIAVLHQGGEKAFKATTELWSIGVTIYQLATGSVPFRPFGGRRNREMMENIHNRLPPGFISGIQYEKNKPVIWSKELPETCLLSQGLRDLVVFLLAGIFERNKQKEWTYDQFFDCVTDITTRKIFHVFYMTEGKEICLYMHPHQNLQDLEDEISVHTEVNPSNQILLFDKSLFSSHIDLSSDVSSFPTTSLDQPLILIDRENKDLKNSSKFGVVSDVNDSRDNNASWERICCIKAYEMKRLVIKLVRCQKLLLQIPKICISILNEKVSKLSSELDILKMNIDAVRNRSTLLMKTGLVVSHFLSAWPNVTNSESYNSNVRIICNRIEEKVSEKMKSVDEVEKKFASLRSSISVIKEQVLTSKKSQNKCEQTFSGCCSLEKCIEQANTYVEEICYIWQTYNPNKIMRGYTFQDQQHIRRLERLKMEQMSSKLSILLKTECVKAVLQTLNKMNPWHIGVQAWIMQCEYSGASLHSFSSDLATFSSSLEQMESDLFELATNIINEFIPSTDSGLNRMPNLRNSNPAVPMRNGNFERRTILQKLRTFEEGLQELRHAAEENRSLIERYNSLLKIIYEDICE